MRTPARLVINVPSFLSFAHKAVLKSGPGVTAFFFSPPQPFPLPDWNSPPLPFFFPFSLASPLSSCEARISDIIASMGGGVCILFFWIGTNIFNRPANLSPPTRQRIVDGCTLFFFFLPFIEETVGLATDLASFFSFPTAS